MAEQHTEQRGYRGRWKKWLLIYLAIGVIVYLVVYFVFIHSSGGYGGGGGGGYGILVPSLYLMDRARAWFAGRRT